jgi:hypothetical protein
MDSIRGDRNKIMIYFEVIAEYYNQQRNIIYSTLLALLLAKIYSKLMHSNGLMSVSSLIKTEIWK